MEFEIDHIIDDIIDTIVSKYKDCSKCGLSKLRSEFYKRKKSKDGLTYECKGCSVKRYQENKEAIAKRSSIHRKENKEAIAKKNARYYKKHKKAIHKLNATYRNNRRRTDEGYRIEECLRSRMNKAMNRTNKSASTMQLIGLETGTQMKQYLELVNPELKDVKCDVDHRLPCALYDLKLPEHQKVCFHYTNLQWLIPQVNKSKNDKYPPELKPELDERGKFKRDAPTVLKQLSLIAHIESHKLTFKQVVDLQRAGQLFEVIGHV